MICSNCKKEISDDSKCCEFCGQKVEITPSQESNQPQSTEQAVQNSVKEESLQEKLSNYKMPKKLLNKNVLAIVIGGGCVALLLVVFMIGLLMNRKKTLNLQDYTEVTFKGYDGYGTATLDFDNEKFMEDIKEYGDLDGVDTTDITDFEDLSLLLQGSTDAYSAVSGVSYELNQSDKLSNGSTVKVTYQFDNEKAAAIDLEFEGEEKEFKVKGLKEIQEIDPFENLVVTFTGMSPNAEVDITSNSSGEVISEIDFEADKSEDIAKGDVITVTADADEEYLLENYGCKLKETSREYTCDKVDEYITKYADISEDYLEIIKSQAKDVIESYFAEQSEYIQAGKFNFEGAYFLTNKDSSTWDSHNILEIVYSSTVKSKDKSFKKSKVYFPVEFTNVQKHADGQCYVDLNSYERKGETSLQYSWSNVSGYTNTATMYNELVVIRKAEYTGESSDNLAK